MSYINPPSAPDKFLVYFEKQQPSKPLQRNGLLGHSVVGYSLLVGVIRPQNGKPCICKGFVGIAQFQGKLPKKRGTLASQGLHAFSVFSEIVVRVGTHDFPENLPPYMP